MKEKGQLRLFCFVLTLSPLGHCWTAMLGLYQAGSESLMGQLGAQGKHGQCETVSFLGGIPRDGGDGGERGGSRKERKKPGEMQQPA